MDVEDQIPPTLPLQKGGIPLFGKEGLGEIFTTICLFNYGLLSNLKKLGVAGWPEFKSQILTSSVPHTLSAHF